MDKAARKTVLNAAAVFLPVLVQLVWLVNNTQLPVADADGMLYSSFTLYDWAMQGKVGDFLHGLYFVRDYRPTILYLVELPFQFLSGGSLLFTSSGVTLLCTAFLCAYLYRLLALHLSKWTAAIGTMFIGLMPGSQWPATYFAFSEIIFLPALLATVYHLIRSHYFREGRHSAYFAVAAFMAFASRPVEAMLHMIPIFAVYFVMAARAKKITATEIVSILLMGLLSATILLGAGWLQGGFEWRSPLFQDAGRGEMFLRLGKAVSVVAALLLTGALAKIVYYNRQRITVAPYAALAFAGLYCAIAGFYLRFIPELVNWVYDTSIGPISQSSNRLPPLDVITRLIAAAGILPLVMLVLISLISCVVCLAKEQRRALLVSPLLVISACIPLPFIIAFMTQQSTPRKLTAALIALVILLMVTALAPGRFLRLRACAIVFISSLQCVGLLWIYTGHPHNALTQHTIGSERSFPAFESARPNPNEAVGKFMIKVAHERHYKVILTPVVIVDDTHYYPVDSFLLSLLMTVWHADVRAVFPYTPTLDLKAEGFAQLFRKYDADAFVIVSDRQRPIMHTADEQLRLAAERDRDLSANEKMAFELLRLHAADAMKTIGAEKIECTLLAPTQYEVCIFAVATSKP